MSEPLAYLHGRFLPGSEARLPIDDRGFLLAATVTDRCRTFRQRLYRLEDHLVRFRQSCTLAQVPLELGDDEIRAIAQELLVHNVPLLNPAQELSLVLFATPGPGDGQPTLGMHTFPLPFARYRSLFTVGARLVVPSVLHIPPACIDRRIKHRSRLHWWLAARQAQACEPGAQPLLLDHRGHVTETDTSNFCVVSNGQVVSPPAESILGGISLLVMKELCQDLGIPFQERDLTLDECLAASEALVTSTPYCLAGVSRLEGQEIPWPGAILGKVLRAWSEQVGVDIAGQILE
jgi:branched-chain amino acid aminotransferase